MRHLKTVYRKLDEFLEYYEEKGKYVSILFRKVVKDIPSTTYVTHGIYYYPAKFIPHVVRFVLTKYTNRDDWVFDPFAGYGTVAIECSLLGRNYIVWDLNPMLEIFVKASTFREDLTLDDLMVDWNYKKEFRPRWSNLYYWHPKEFLHILSKIWGYYHYEVPEKMKPVLAIPLLKVTKYFSYADLQVAKLYKSKKAKERISKLLKSDWLTLMRKMYNEEAKEVVEKINEFNSKNPKEVEFEIKAGIDSLKEKLRHEVDILLTSPPYLQAQEYIRSFKLELFWLGYTEEYVRRLSKLEIPYNTPPDIEVKSKTYKEYREKVKKLNHNKLLELYDAYFKSLAYFLERNHDKVRKYMCIFVGPVKIRNIRIPIDEILKEVLENLGWRHEKTYIDTIVSRKLFESQINPATGLPDERTPTEHLLIMKKTS